MIRELLTPDAHTDPYVWSAVLLAHAAIGVAGWALIGWWAVPLYVMFEVVQALAARVALFWDSVLDACGVTCGSLLAASLWAHDPWVAGAAVAVTACIAVAGWIARAK